MSGWFGVLLVIALAATSVSEVFGDISGLFTIALLAFIYGAATSPLLAAGYALLHSTRGLVSEVDAALRPRVGYGLRWRLFWAIVLGGPLLMAAMSIDVGRSFDIFSLLAQVNAALIIAVVLDSRHALGIVGHGGSPPERMTLRLAFLTLMGLGTAIVVAAAATAQSKPPPGVSFDLALIIGLGYGQVSCISGIVLLCLNAGARLLGVQSSSSGAGSESDGPQPSSTESARTD
jgi:hypothetical protein